RIRTRHAEFNRRLQQLDADIAREEQMVGDNADILKRLDDEEATLRRESSSSLEREASTREALDTATATLKVSEEELERLTAERAEAVATRTQLERRLQETGERRDRLEKQL